LERRIIVASPRRKCLKRNLEHEGKENGPGRKIEKKLPRREGKRGILPPHKKGTKGTREGRRDAVREIAPRLCLEGAEEEQRYLPRRNGRGRASLPLRRIVGRRLRKEGGPARFGSSTSRGKVKIESLRSDGQIKECLQSVPEDDETKGVGGLGGVTKGRWDPQIQSHTTCKKNHKDFSIGGDIREG